MHLLSNRRFSELNLQRDITRPFDSYSNIEGLHSAYACSNERDKIASRSLAFRDKIVLDRKFGNGNRLIILRSLELDVRLHMLELLRREIERGKRLS